MPETMSVAENVWALPQLDAFQTGPITRSASPAVANRILGSVLTEMCWRFRQRNGGQGEKWGYLGASAVS